MIFDFEQAAEVLNFGAFLAFMGVNLAVIRKFYLEPERQRRRLVSGLLLPLSGFLFCFAIWISLPGPAKRIGWTWLALGFAYHVLASRGFRRPPPEIDLSDA
jgi:amino acid transporter